MKIQLSKEMYPKEAILKAAYFFTEEYYISLDCDRLYYYVEIKPIDGNADTDVENRFLNEVLIQATRYSVVKQTKNIRELILGRAFASTLIANGTSDANSDCETNGIKADDILYNWFEVNEK